LLFKRIDKIKQNQSNLWSAMALSIDYLRLPHCPENQLIKHNPTDVGFDIYLTHDTWVYPYSQIPYDNERDEYRVPLQPTGVILAPPTTDHWFGLYPRSSTIKKGVALANTVGIIDPTYTGELLLALYSLHKPILLKAEKAIAQLVIHHNITTEFNLIENDPRFNKRGGFGSTDSKSTIPSAIPG
jgi:dUTPase